MLLLQHVILWSFALQNALRVLDFVQVPDHINESAFIVIAVLSAQNNFKARASIRDTWKSLTNRPDVRFYFLIGRNICLTHPTDRKSPLACEALEFQSDENAAWTPVRLDDNDTIPGGSGVSSFTFRVNFPVIIRGVRLWKQAVQGSTVAIVNLKNAKTGHLVTSFSFEVSASLHNESSWLEIETSPFLFPKSFDVEVQLHVQHTEDYREVSVPCSGLSNWVDLSGAVEFTSQFKPDVGWVNFDNKSCTPISLFLELNDVDKHLKEKDSRSMQWQSHVETLSQDLEREAATEKDVLFLDVVDVYKNIPKKLLQFYKWVTKAVRFTYLLKTDDDTFIDIPVVIKFLESIPSTDLSQMWWWGKLRHGLPVERHGKWQELQYAAPVYPPFLCGGGYIINKLIVDYLVTNIRWLYPFQGEDTSLGIWLSGVHPVFPKNASCKWSCASECEQTLCNRCQLSTDELILVWQKYKGKGTLC